MGLYKLIENKRKRQKRRSAAKVLAIATATTTAGILSGILLAPKSGKETRDDIKEKVGQTNEHLKNKSVDFRNNLTESKNKIKEYLSSKKESKISESQENEIIEEQANKIIEESKVSDTQEIQEVN